MKDLFPYLALMVSACACAVSIWTAIRASKWRNSEAHALLVKKVHDLESWKSLASRQLQDIEHDLTQLPTAADFARLSGAIATTNAIAERTEAGVRRLEQYWLENRP